MSFFSLHCGVSRTSITAISQLGKLAQKLVASPGAVLVAVSGSGFLTQRSVPAGSAASLSVKLYFIWGDVQVPQFHMILEI